MVYVKWIDGSISEFESRQDAQEEIAESFANSGENPVDEVWEGKEDNETVLSAHWTVELQDI